MPHALGGLSVPTATRRSRTPGAESEYQPVQLVVPSAMRLQKTLSPLLTRTTSALEAGVPWLSPQQDAAPMVVEKPQADTYWPLT